MAKIRGVKPDYWTDEDIVELSIAARLLFIGLWNQACDNGHLEDKSKQIKMRVLPADDVNVAELLRELAGKGRIRRSDGWITIPNFTKHQKPDRRYFQTCKKAGCVKPGAETTDSQRETRGGHAEPTSGTHGGHDVGSWGPRGDGDGEVMVRGSDGDVSGVDTPDAGRSPVPAIPERQDVERICTHLAEQVEATGSKRPTITARWRTEARLMLDRDGRTEEQVHACIRWLFTSTHPDALFWRPNVRAIPKLRAEYDRLRQLAERQGRSTDRNQGQADLLARAMERAVERERSGS